MRPFGAPGFADPGVTLPLLRLAAAQPHHSLEVFCGYA